MAEGRRRVQERFGVALEPEVQTLGPVRWPWSVVEGLYADAADRLEGCSDSSRPCHDRMQKGLRHPASLRADKRW